MYSNATIYVIVTHVLLKEAWVFHLLLEVFWRDSDMLSIAWSEVQFFSPPFIYLFVFTKLQG